MKADKFTKETINRLGVTEKKYSPFAIGDTIAVYQRIKEGGKERIQIFEGDVIAMHNNGASSTFTVRKISANAVSVEKIFPVYSPLIANVKFIRKGKVRRAKLYYMRNRIGKAARVKELIVSRNNKKETSRAKVKADGVEQVSAS